MRTWGVCRLGILGLGLECCAASPVTLLLCKALLFCSDAVLAVEAPGQLLLGQALAQADHRQLGRADHVFADKRDRHDPSAINLLVSVLRDASIVACRIAPD